MLVSIIMPLYNTDKAMLKNAIESILCQTYKNFEFIIVCDNPTDDSDQIAQYFAQMDSRIRVIQNIQNMGVAKSLNRGLKEAKGEFIARMDADDISLPNRIEIQLSFLLKNEDVGAVFSGINIIDENDKVVGKSRNRMSEGQIITSLFFGCKLVHPTVMFRKSALEQLQYFYAENRKAEDYDLWTRFVMAHIKLHQISQRLYNYRIHSNQVTNVNKDQLSSDAIDVVFQLLEFCKINANKYEIEQYLKYMGSIENIDKNSVKMAKNLMLMILHNNQIAISKCYLYMRWIEMHVRRIIKR